MLIVRFTFPLSEMCYLANIISLLLERLKISHERFAGVQYTAVMPMAISGFSRRYRIFARTEPC